MITDEKSGVFIPTLTDKELRTLRKKAPILAELIDEVLTLRDLVRRSRYDRFVDEDLTPVIDSITVKVP